MTLEDIIEELKNDKRNEDYTKRGIPPIFQINEESKILLIGQAPGRVVEETGIPFNDKSGDKLREWLGISRDVFYSNKVSIMPMDFYYPGKGKTGDLPPRPFIAKEYHQKLLKLMPNIKLTILIGSYSINYYLKDGKKKTLTETVRNYKEYLPYFPIVHPSPLNFRWLKKNPWFEEEVVKNLKNKVQDLIKE